MNLNKKSPHYKMYRPFPNKTNTYVHTEGRGYPVIVKVTQLCKLYGIPVHRRAKKRLSGLCLVKRQYSEVVYRIDLLDAIEAFGILRFLRRIRNERELRENWQCRNPYQPYYDKFLEDPAELNNRGNYVHAMGSVKAMLCPPPLYPAYMTLHEGNWCGEGVPISPETGRYVSTLQRDLKLAARELRHIHDRYRVLMYQGWTTGVYAVDTWDDTKKDLVARKVSNVRPVMYRREIMHLYTHNLARQELMYDVRTNASLRDIENLAFKHGLYDPDCYPYLCPLRLSDPLAYLDKLERKVAKNPLTPEELWDFCQSRPEKAKALGIWKEFSIAERYYDPDI